MKLILFFNGWGVPKKIFNRLKIYDYEVKVIDLEENIDLKNLKKYERIDVIAWSFGVYNASKQLSNLNIKISKKIAINGSVNAIHKRYGISPIIFKKTLESLDRERYFDFMENIGLDIRYLKDNKDWKNYREILDEFGKNYREIPSIFEYSLISTKDKIFPSRSLINYYKDTGYKLIEEEHYPFERWNSWGEILDEF